MQSPLLAYKKEFPEPEFEIDADLIETLTALGFQDASWHNDACPAFTRGNLKVYTGGEDNEDAGGYSLHIIQNSGEAVDGVAPQSFDDILEFVNAIQAAIMVADFMATRIAKAVARMQEWGALTSANFFEQDIAELAPFTGLPQHAVQVTPC